MPAMLASDPPGLPLAPLVDQLDLSFVWVLWFSFVEMVEMSLWLVIAGMLGFS